VLNTLKGRVPSSRFHHLIKPQNSKASVSRKQPFILHSSPYPIFTQRLTRKAYCSMAASTPADRDILPDTVKPSNYAISLYDIELGGAFSYKGTVAITANIKKSTKSIILNSHQLKVHGAEVVVEFQKTKQTIPSTAVSYDAPKQRVTIDFADELPATENVLITIKFQGTINNDMAGFYRSKYKPAVPAAASVPKDDEFHYMFSTQFESSDARRAFPCFDEPNIKATFDVELELPDDQVALSNMPEKEVKKSKPGFQVVSFERTPVMSTYLLAWAIGDFEYVEAFTKRQYNGKNLPVRVYTTKGLKEQGTFALEHAHQIVDYFSEIFKIDYPLPKADLLAVHEFVSISLARIPVFDHSPNMAIR
jgi:aminopeptidase N